MGGLQGADNTVWAAVVHGSGNLYIGGDFTVVGEVLANRIAKWNGSAWSALGSGMNSAVRAVAVSGSDLYAGGFFTTAGGKVSAYLAKAEIAGNTAPTDLLLSQNTVAENQPAGTAVGSLTAVDGNPGDTHTFTLVSGIGDNDNAVFAIVGDELQTAVVFDYENKDSYSIRVRATDAGGLFVEKSFVIQVEDVNEAPFVANPLEDLTGTYGHAFAATFPEDTFADPDFGQTLSYTASGLPPGIALDASTRTFSGTPIASGDFTVTVDATDPHGESAGSTFIFSIFRAPLLLETHNATRVYGDPNPVFTGSVTGLKNGDDITVTGWSTLQTSRAGAYSIVPVLHDLDGKAGNYNISYGHGTLTVTPAPLLVETHDATRVYGDPNPEFTGTVTGLKNGDNITASFWSASEGSPVGQYSIVPVLHDPDNKQFNYVISYSHGTLMVTPPRC
jgi:hypothetical protein